MTPPAGAPAWLVALEGTGLARAMREWFWLYPAVEIVHLAGLALLVGAAVMFDLRLLGLSRRVPVAALARHLLPWARVGLGLMAVSGVLMFTAHATEFGTSPLFGLKIGLILAACLNAAVFHRWPFRSVAAWDVGHRSPAPARTAALLSLVLWTGAVACGRLLAYY